MTRLARFTGGPYQSPPRLTATPPANPARNWGNPCSPPARSTSERTVSTSDSGVGDTNITASPIVFTSRTGGPTASIARSLSPGDETAELDDVDPLAQAREADHVGEADPDPAQAARRTLDELGSADLLRCGGHARWSRIVWSMSGVTEPKQLPGRLGVASGELVLVRPRLQQHPREHVAHRLGRLGDAATEHARDLEQALLRQPDLTQARERVRRVQVLLVEGLVVRVGPREPDRLPHREQNSSGSARPARPPPGGYARLARQHPLDRQQAKPVLGECLLHVVDRDAFGGEVLQECQPSLALAPVEPVEQAGFRELLGRVARTGHRHVLEDYLSC